MGIRSYTMDLPKFENSQKHAKQTCKDLIDRVTRNTQSKPRQGAQNWSKWGRSAALSARAQAIRQVVLQSKLQELTRRRQYPDNAQYSALIYLYIQILQIDVHNKSRRFNIQMH